MLRTLLAISSLLMVAATPARRPAKTSAPAAKSAAASKELAKFLDEEWELGLREYPERAT